MGGYDTGLFVYDTFPIQYQYVVSLPWRYIFACQWVPVLIVQKVWQKTLDTKVIKISKKYSYGSYHSC